MRKTLEERFWSKVLCDVETGCWNWTGATTHGYGQIFLDSKNITGRPHRVVFQLTGVDIPEGLEPDHLCKNKLCVRPDHMELVTHSENAHRQ